MKNHFLKNIEISHFKCFNGFKAEGFQRVNLIGGKNNVGKTVFMEACYINVCSQNLRQMIDVLGAVRFMREAINLAFREPSFSVEKFLEYFNGISIESNVNRVQFFVSDKDGKISYEFSFGGENLVVDKKKFYYETENTDHVEFIDNLGWDDDEICSSYASVQKRDGQPYINALLVDFDSAIEGFKVIDDKPLCKVDGVYRPITEFGDGVKHLLSIAIAFFSAEKGYVFIDEIDNGIHYTMLKQVWTFIFELAEKFDVQVFATTHSLECISAFNDVQNNMTAISSSYFELAKEKKTQDIFMTALDADQLQYELQNTGKFRGE